MPHAEPSGLPHRPLTAVLFGLSGCLVDFGARLRLQSSMQPTAEQALATPGALDTLHHLRQRGIPCAWLEQLSPAQARHLSASLPEWIHPAPNACNPWPAPDACWQALMALKVKGLDGCVLVSGEPHLLQSGLNAGLWTIGLASCGSLCGMTPSEWQALDQQERELKRGKATMQLFGLGVHSVIDHLGDLNTCLADIELRRLKGEKP
ncbi:MULTISPECIES: phosphatase [Pseudomonas]|uniref:HAD family phosphatase n=1 Tax=Pseudomonas sessilinigenes TaxID=658629 RepID=A0ABX8MX03_9PSED|nr:MULTISPECIES: phosphatase [Pseudomonas]AZC23756.1 Phosphonoacetaldehyde phosphonohydrolase-related protein [Pseudomonas sessilinigenes]QIH09301.1 HAD family phosphatase [Pseudomonas sp. BIOMIG1BAC]QXH42744.1 HAD family phosphatase [Pseudomonas sessilinigenes]UMZ14020.1 HAD family phosphatase [Pseudomonas sp. MPFS]